MNVQLLKECIRKNMLRGSVNFLMEPPDPPANDTCISKVESLFGLDLPQLYKDFLIEFGGGSFGFIDIYSTFETGKYYIGNVVNMYDMFAKNGFVPISDDYCGGLYCLKFDTISDLSVYYYNDEDGFIKTRFSNVFQFVAECAF
jgi:SMI1-KNR4 cell-wall